MFNIIKIQSIRNILLLAVLIRLLIMPFFLHPDIKTYNFQASFLKQGVWNIYDYLSANKDRLTLKDEFVYFPLTYFFLGSYQVITSPLLGSGFDNWLSNANSNANLDIGVFRYLFILKFPYLVLDILIAFVLSNIFSNLQIRKKVFALWLLNPFSIVLIYIYSNVDIFPVFLVVLSLHYALKNNFTISSLALGLGAGFKAFPLLLVPFLLLKTVTIKDKVLVVVFSFGALLFTILPFLGSTSFKESTLVSGLTTRVISSGINLGFGEILMPAVIFLSILFFWGAWKKMELWRHYLGALLLILISIHFHIQWLLWLIPLLVIGYVSGSEKEKKFIAVLLLLAFVIPLLYADKFMTIGLLQAISPLFDQLPTPQLVLSKIYDPTTVRGVLQSILFGLGLLLSRIIMSKE